MGKSFPTQLKPPECSRCKSSAEYYCRTCKQDLEIKELWWSMMNKGAVLKKTINRLQEHLREIQISETGKRQTGVEQLLELVPTPLLQISFTTKRTWLFDDDTRHISFVSSDFAWISSRNNLKLIYTTGETLHDIKDKCKKNGVHAVTGQGDLIYIDEDYEIKKNQVRHYNKVNGKGDKRALEATLSLLFSLQWEFTDWNDKTGYMYSKENQNGDVIVSYMIDNVSELGYVVVTDRTGIHRFTYKGSKPGSEFKPRGICTDALSNVLVCDSTTRTVQMINKDGQFLSVLLTEQQGIEDPYSLSYDYKSHRLWAITDNPLMLQTNLETQLVA
ncbi:uncharacterized protein LOC134237461 [Saccostrea cucullata]|uniref:uncharacterized protein LOC134237461 n=1 Tax=Saccostrea cuccullata TaxID=36930 RepID=UPI002ED0EBB3